MPWKECHKMDERMRFVSHTLTSDRVQKVIQIFLAQKSTALKNEKMPFIRVLLLGRFSMKIFTREPLINRKPGSSKTLINQRLTS